MVLIIYKVVVERSDSGNMFPSPYGDYGSYLQSDNEEMKEAVQRFPSPYGDYGSYRWEVMQRTYIERQGFRPLTGIMVLIEPRICNGRRTLATFPSPYGDYGSYLRSSTS